MQPSRTHPFRRDKRPGLDVVQTDSGEPVDQLDLEFGRERRLFVLQAVAWADFDNLDRSRVRRPRERCGLAQRASESAASPPTRTVGHPERLDGALQHFAVLARVCRAKRDVSAQQVGQAERRAEPRRKAVRKHRARSHFGQFKLFPATDTRQSTSGTRQSCRPACALPVATTC